MREARCRRGQGADFSLAWAEARDPRAGPRSPVVAVRSEAGRSSGAASVVPFELRSNLIVVRGAVAGRPVLLAVDTGAQISMLSPEAAGRLGIDVGAGRALPPVRSGPRSCRDAHRRPAHPPAGVSRGRQPLRRDHFVTDDSDPGHRRDLGRGLPRRLPAHHRSSGSGAPARGRPLVTWASRSAPFAHAGLPVCAARAPRGPLWQRPWDVSSDRPHRPHGPRHAVELGLMVVLAR